MGRFLIVFALAVGAEAQGWVPVDCTDRLAEIEALKWSGEGTAQQRWSRYEQSVRDAKPGAPNFAPRPYPATRSEILENFEYALREVVLGDSTPEDLGADEGRLLREVDARTVRIEVARVENWSLSRCSTDLPAPFYFLLRLYSGESGIESGRGVLLNSGLWGAFSVRPSSIDPEAWSSRLPSLDRARDVLRDSFGIATPIADLQYVSADGVDRCSTTHPCIAFRSGGRTLLWVSGERLVEVDLGAPLLSVTQRRRQAIAERGAPAPVDGEPWISVGFAWARATEVRRSTG